MNCYLGQPVWIADGMPHWRFPGAVHLIDLRTFAECATPEKYGDRPVAFAMSDADLRGQGYYMLCKGDPRDAKVDALILDKWLIITGVKVQGDTVADLLVHHLTTATDPRGLDSCRPLMPTVSREIEIVCGPMRIVRSYRHGMDPLTNAVETMLQEDFRTAFDDPTVSHEKTLDYWCDKLRLSKDDREQWERLIPADLREHVEGPEPHDTTLTDNFNRANENPVTGWTESGTSKDFAVSSNQMVLGGSFGHDRYSASSLSGTDMEVNSTIKVHAAGSFYIGVATARVVDGGTDYSIWDNNDRSRQLYKGAAATYTSLGGPSGTFANNDIALVGANGSTIYAKQNGTQIFSVTDTAITSGNYGGVACYGTVSATGDMVIDDWQAADLAVAGQPTMGRLGMVPYAASLRPIGAEGVAVL